MIYQPIIDYKLSREYTHTWKAMEKLVDKGKTKLIGMETPYKFKFVFHILIPLNGQGCQTLI